MVLRHAARNHVDRIFNEAEQVVFEDGVDDSDIDVVDLPDTGLPSIDKAEGEKRGRRPLPANLPRERVEYDLPDDQKFCPCCSKQMHRRGRGRHRAIAYRGGGEGLAKCAGTRQHLCYFDGSCFSCITIAIQISGVVFLSNWKSIGTLLHQLGLTQILR